MRENRKFKRVSRIGSTVIATTALSLTLGAASVIGTHSATAAGPTVAPTAGSAVSPPTANRVTTAGTRVSARWAGAVNTSSRDAVNSAYWSAYAPKLSLPIDWLGGSILACLPGLSSLGSDNATLSALNYVRSLAGLAPVTFSQSMNSAAQRAALLMDANDALDHHPSSNWRCWSQTGATAASKSNLALAWPSLNSGQIIAMYMDDRGDTNVAAGHRRWILNPFSTVMGTGSTSTANALTVIGPSRSSNPNPRYVGWPTQGWFPSTMEPSGRWSLSSGLKSVTFANARVRVYRNGALVPSTRYQVHNGYAQPTLVWQLGSSVPRSGNFRVVVTNIRRAGIHRALKYSYGVNLFTPFR